ncbi:zf-HC2 domain-containing protein [Novipirellula sp. SH528]|uniref:zf-HC2 domain-containing protein n=1 Tax=Novipirellula sp. SH528 TaxID=3454466 RepID=UPI003F9EDB4D
MRCDTIKEQLSVYFDGELSVALSEEIRSHLESCESCQAEIASFEQIRGLGWGIDAAARQAPPWSAVAARLNETQQPVVLADRPASDKRKSSRIKGILAVVATIAASILILVWTQRPDEPSPKMAHSGHSHHGAESGSVSAIDFQDVVSLQREDTLVAMQSLSMKYQGREASIEQVERDMGYKPSVESTLTGGTKLVSTQLLRMPDCNCAEGECTCGPGECNCVACVCQRPDGSTFIVIEQCRGQNVNFGDLPVQRVRRGKHELHVSQSDQGFAVTWKADRGRMTAFGLRDLNELDTLLAVN